MNSNALSPSPGSVPIEVTVTYILVIGACVASAFVTRVVRDVALHRRLLDVSNERSAHVRPTPRLGGIGLMAVFLPIAAGVFISAENLRGLGIIGVTAFVAAVGLVDDLYPLAARWRFCAQLVGAACVVGLGWTELHGAWTIFAAPSWLMAPVSVLWIVWLTNLYNFMDGIDGIAGGQTVIAACAIAVYASLAGAAGTVVVALTLAATAAGFLFLNFPPASIFMGDVGSTAIGFFFAALPFLPGSRIPVEVVGLSLALFILDATTTLVRRLVRGERFYQAHRSHWYQRPLACGVPHRTITLAAWAGMVVVAALALEYGQVATTTARLSLPVAAIAVFCGYVVAVRSLERRRASRAAPVPQPRR
jgi:Fuc2NAc and GlcNAc transferase